MPGPNRAEWNVVREHEPDCRFDLLWRGAENRAIHGCRSDRAVHDVVDLVVLESKNFGKPAADLVERDHGCEQSPTIEAGDLRSRHCRWVKVVVSKLACGG